MLRMILITLSLVQKLRLTQRSSKMLCCLRDLSFWSEDSTAGSLAPTGILSEVAKLSGTVFSAIFFLQS